MKFYENEITTGTQTLTSFSINFGAKLSEFHPFLPSFLLSASSTAAATYIFTAPTTCTITIITLEPCALNAKFQHFIMRFSKKFFTLLWIPLKKEGIGG